MEKNYNSDEADKVVYFTPGSPKILTNEKEGAHQMRVWEWAIDQGETIGGKSALDWALDNDKIENIKTFVEKSIEEGRNIEGKDPIIYAAKNNIKVYDFEEERDIDPIEWAFKNDYEIDGKDPIEWAVENNIKINGKPAKEYQEELGKGLEWDVSHEPSNLEPELEWDNLGFDSAREKTLSRKDSGVVNPTENVRVLNFVDSHEIQKVMQDLEEVRAQNVSNTRKKPRAPTQQNR